MSHTHQNVCGFISLHTYNELNELPHDHPEAGTMSYGLGKPNPTVPKFGLNPDVRINSTPALSTRDSGCVSRERTLIKYNM